MKLTKAQRNLLQSWQELDTEAGCRQWHRAWPMQSARAYALWQAGILERIQSETIVYRLTDEAVTLLTGGES